MAQSEALAGHCADSQRGSHLQFPALLDGSSTCPEAPSCSCREQHQADKVRTFLRVAAAHQNDATSVSARSTAQF